MIEPPSKQLVETLSRLGLCSPGDLRRCRPYVRRLARDLPAFDSVWIDALVHGRKLTHFQARLIESGQAERLRIGPCLISQRLGQGATAETYLARHQTNRERCVLKRIDCPLELRPSKLKLLEQLCARVGGGIHSSIVAPNACLEHDDRLVTVSRFVSGPHLGELLVRRGRFAAANVIEVARQLLDGLAALEGEGFTHGEVHLRNVRLTAGGVAVLVDAGVAGTVAPELNIHARRPPERYDGIAPELIGTGNHPNSASDLYALGCLLWQLLAGRPVYSTGDSLGKLVAHQTRTMLDVRHWAPDTPAPLADAVAAFTARDPRDRPPSFCEARERLGAAGRCGQRRLRRFRTTFQTAVPRRPIGDASAARKRWPVLVLLLFAAAGLAAAMLDAGARSDPLSLPGRISGYIRQAGANFIGDRGGDRSSGQPREADGQRGGHQAADSARLRRIPAPDAGGLILLDSDGPYACRPVAAAGPLTIRAAKGRHPQILVTRTPCRLSAEQVTLENVHFRRANLSGHSQPAGGNGGAPLSALLLVESAQLSLRGGSFQTHRLTESMPAKDANRPPPLRPVGLAWKLPIRRLPGEGRIVIRDTVFAGGAAAVFLSDVPAALECDNCLKVGGGPLLTLGDNIPARQALWVRLTQVTLRQAGALLRWRPDENRDAAGYVTVQADDCVFDLAGRDAALFQFVGSRPVDAAIARIEMTGSGSLARSGLIESTRISADASVAAFVDPAVVELEGIAAGPFAFAGPPGLLPTDSVVSSFQVPRRTADPPGIDVDRLSLPVPRPALAEWPRRTATVGN